MYGTAVFPEDHRQLHDAHQQAMSRLVGYWDFEGRLEV